MDSIESIQPSGWKKPKGYSNGMLAPKGTRTLHVGGQIAWNADQELVGAGDFAAQFRQALANVVEVVHTAGGHAGQIANMTVFVTDKQAYLASAKEIGVAWRELVGRHYPAMALVQVADLLEEGAMVEIQATAELP